MLLPFGLPTILFGWILERQERKRAARAQAEARRKDRELSYRAGIIRSKLAAKQRQNWFNVPVDLQNADRETILRYGERYLDKDEDPRVSLESLEPGDSA